MRNALHWLDRSRVATTLMLGAVFASIILTTPSIGDAGAPLTGSHNGLQVFEVLGLGVAVWQATRLRSKTPTLDIIAAAVTGAAGLLHLESLAIFGAAAYLYLRNRSNLYDRAAAAITVAVGVQALLAPLIFARLSSFILPLDAGAAGSILKLFVRGASWHGTIVSGRPGHSVNILAGCSSFHNLSLASLCWVTVTMMTRPYWTPRDPVVFAAAACLQIASNVVRLSLVSISLPMYEFWHDGMGIHIFAAAATTSAILISFYGARWALPRVAGEHAIPGAKISAPSGLIMNEPATARTSV